MGKKRRRFSKEAIQMANRYEKMITNYQGNAYQNHNAISHHTL